ncbi:LVIVD repeat-containing protein [Pyxidicoccus xibeiensis]|uniref:LVIVD repeat-containing protein n=1 Tax=Pyxidicoccus xibeiensis TaxID=2906759 RepID=UPI0020A6F1CE|nr:hypothetical protein [Pyxidicoccus xibeiensis]MCP3137293.1 hypothetical protein [Pyxidicoccus xibeiensis]
MTSSPRPSRALLCACVGLLLAIQGCDDPPDPRPDASVPVEDSGTPDTDAGVPDAGDTDSGTPDAGDTDSGTPDAGDTDSGTPDAGDTDSGTPDASTSEPWDGGYTVLPETGNWVDRGRFADCNFASAGDPTTVACDDLSRYELSSCDPAALAEIPPEGIYSVAMRTERRLADGGTRVTPVGIGFKLLSDGGTDTMGGGYPINVRNTDGGTFFVASTRVHPVLPRQVTALAGCQVPRAGLITGCFARCIDGRFSGTGTFEAHRLAVHPYEPDSSGWVNLISEARVELGTPADIYVTKNHAYVVSINGSDASNGGLTVFDITDRRFPILKTAISLPGDNYWNGVWAKGDALYIGSTTSGTIVYDITNPAAPEFVRNLPSGPYGTHTVLVDGDRLYAMSSDGGTFVYDVSNPLRPILLQTITLPEELSSAGPHDSFAYQGRLYIANGFGGYSVMDVTDLNNVRHLGQYIYPSGYAHHLAVGTFAGQTIAFAGGESMGAHVRVLNVTEPASMVKIGEFRLRPVTSIHNMLLKGTRLYVAWYHEGLRVLDVANPTQPRQIAHYHTFRESDPARGDNVIEGAIGIRVPDDGYVYVVDMSRGLLIFNEP